MTPAAHARLLGRAALGLLYPRRCPFCGQVLGFVPDCPACAPQLAQLTLAPKRLRPQEHYFGQLAGAAAVYRYQGCVRQAIHSMKYSGCRWYGSDLGNAMASQLFGCTFAQKYGILYPERAPAARMEYDLIVPVPKTDRKRGYNVPLLLAQPLAQGLGLPLQPDALRRIRATAHQAGLAREQRLANVAGAFAPAPGCRAEGKRVLLVDDVITTGATAAACAQALLQAGADSVYAVGLAAAMPRQHDR